MDNYAIAEVPMTFGHKVRTNPIDKVPRYTWVSTLYYLQVDMILCFQPMYALGTKSILICPIYLLCQTYLLVQTMEVELDRKNTSLRCLFISGRDPMEKMLVQAVESKLQKRKQMGQYAYNFRGRSLFQNTFEEIEEVKSDKTKKTWHSRTKK
ncbi:hypothetical protein LXL04_024096 [Taraxacum kok-saghyz]